jgi:hypothetical protein
MISAVRIMEYAFYERIDESATHRPVLPDHSPTALAPHTLASVAARDLSSRTSGL